MDLRSFSVDCHVMLCILASNIYTKNWKGKLHEGLNFITQVLHIHKCRYGRERGKEREREGDNYMYMYMYMGAP